MLKLELVRTWRAPGSKEMHSFELVSRIRQSNIPALCRTVEEILRERKRKENYRNCRKYSGRKTGVVSISCVLSHISLLYKSYIHYPIGIYMIPILIVSEYSSFFVSLLRNRGVSLYRVLWFQEWVIEINYLTCGNITSELQIGEVNKVFFNSKSNYWFILLPLLFYISQRKSNFYLPEHTHLVKSRT